MIKLIENVENICIFTLSEMETTYTGPGYFLNLKHCLTNVEVNNIIIVDYSLTPERFNEFRIAPIKVDTDVDDFSILTTTVLGLESGYYDYEVTTFGSPTIVLEIGKLMVESTTDTYKTIDNEVTYKTFKNN